MYIVQGVQLGGTLNNTEHFTAKHNTLHWVEMYLTNTNINSNRIVVPQRWNHAHMRRNYWSEWSKCASLRCSGHYSEGKDSRSCLSFETNGTETSSLVLVSLQFWLLISLVFGITFLFIFPKVSGLVTSQNIQNLEHLLRSRHILILVSRLKARDSRSRPGLVPLLIIKTSWA